MCCSRVGTLRVAGGSGTSDNMTQLDEEFYGKFDAVLFDLDGVITDTARVHSSAWKRMFDDYLRSRAAETGEKDVELFDPEADYLAYVDGKPRYEGVQTFLMARGIDLPWGDPSDAPERNTICGLGNRKDRLVGEILASDGVFAFPGSIAVLELLRENGVKLGVVSSSKNCKAVLGIAGLEHFFDVRVDGIVAAERRLPGKPAPDTFREAARELGVDPKRTVVVEDALAGVEAGRSGGFGLVIGVSRHGEAESLKTAGADVVVPDLEVLIEADESESRTPDIEKKNA
jgi:trehalose 6-phosphate phosphatase